MSARLGITVPFSDFGRERQIRPQSSDHLVRVWMVHDKTVGAIKAGPPERPQLGFWLPLHRIARQPLMNGIVRLTIPRDLAEELELP